MLRVPINSVIRLLRPRSLSRDRSYVSALREFNLSFESSFTLFTSGSAASGDGFQQERSELIEVLRHLRSCFAANGFDPFISSRETGPNLSPLNYIQSHQC